MAHAHEPGGSAGLQRRSGLRRVRGGHRQRDSRRTGFCRRRPAPRGHRRRREVRRIRGTREVVRSRAQVSTLSPNVSDLDKPTTKLVAGIKAHRSNLILALLCAAQFMLIQDFAGALVSPAALSLLTTTFKEGPDRNRALGMWSAMAAGGASAGLILGGLLTQELSWRFTLFINLPLGLAAIVLSPVLSADVARRGAKVSLDVPGAVSLTGGVLALAYGVTEATGQGFASIKVLIALALSAVLLIAFVVVEKRSSQPLVPGRMLRQRSVVAGNSVAVLVSVVMIGAVFFNSLYLQEILGYSPIQAGLAWLPQTVLIMVVSNVGARIAMKLGARTLIAVGTFVLGAGMLLFLRTAPESDYVTVLIPAMLVTGLRVGLAFVSVTMAATAGVPDRDQGIASGLIGTAQQVGMAVGLAILVNIAGSVTRVSLPQGAGAVIAGYHQAFVIAAAISFVAAIVALIVIKRPSTRPAAGGAVI